MYCINKYPLCLSITDVYRFFDYFYPNRSIYRLIGAYSYKTLKCIKLIHLKHVSIKRIYKIEYLIISKRFEISYFKRHYRRTGSIYIRP